MPCGDSSGYHTDEYRVTRLWCCFQITNTSTKNNYPHKPKVLGPTLSLLLRPYTLSIYQGRTPSTQYLVFPPRFNLGTMTGLHNHLIWSSLSSVFTCLAVNHAGNMGLDFVLRLRAKFGGCLIVCNEGTTFYSHISFLWLFGQSYELSLQINQWIFRSSKFCL